MIMCIPWTPEKVLDRYCCKRPRCVAWRVQQADVLSVSITDKLIVNTHTEILVIFPMLCSTQPQPEQYRPHFGDLFVHWRAEITACPCFFCIKVADIAISVTQSETREC